MADAFTELVLNAILGLYPREWRNRYGGEVRELIQALSQEQRRSVIGMLPSLIAGATAERLHAFRRFDRAGVAAAIIVTAVAFGGSVGIAHRIDARHDTSAQAGASQRLDARAPASPGRPVVAMRASGRAGRARSTP